MITDQYLEQYKILVQQAMDLRLAIRSIKDQITQGGSADWLSRARRALTYKELNLVRVKDEMKALRVVLRDVKVE